MSSHAKLELEVLDSSLVVTRLAADAAIPDWAHGQEFTCITRSRDELSIVCEQELIPQSQDFEGPFRAIRVQGQLAFTEIGIVEALARPLADAAISIFVVSSFDTDYVLVPQTEFERSLTALRGAGHSIAMA